MTMKKYFAAAALVWLLAFTTDLAAQNTALGFIRIDRNPRTSALAGAGAASADNGAYAAFRNAATLSFLPGLGDVAGGVQLWEMSNEVDKTTNLLACTGFRFGKFGVALGTAFQMGVPVSAYNPSDLLVSLGLSYAIFDGLSLGVNARFAQQNFTQAVHVNGFSADVTVFGKIDDAISLIGGVACLGPKVKGSAAAYSQPSYAHVGAAWHKAFAEHGISLALDAECNFDGGVAGAVGAVYSYDQTAFLRVGYRLSGKNVAIPSHLALGVGVQLHGFRADVSYLTASPVLGNTLSIGVGYSF